jgi:hypothetical protein
MVSTESCDEEELVQRVENQFPRRVSGGCNTKLAVAGFGT